MPLPAAELALFDPVTDLPLFGIMTEAISDVSAEVKAAQVSAAIDEVLSWIPNCTRPITTIGPYLQRVIGKVASCYIVMLSRGIQGRDQDMVDKLQAMIDKERTLIIATGAKDAIRVTFTDSTPDVDDFATIGGGSLTADEWAQP